MNVLIINMPIRECAKPNNVPLGIYYLGSALDGYADVQYLDLNALRYSPTVAIETILDLIALNKIDIVMLSGLITTYKWQRFLATEIKEEFPAVQVFSGGGLASNLGETLMQWIPAIDAICIGEGEEAAVRMLHRKRDGERVYRSESMNVNECVIDWEKVVCLETYIENPIWGAESKNSSAIDYSMRRSLNMITSRGCPSKCAFCSRKMTGGGRFRGRKALSVVEEASKLVRDFKCDFIGFLDDNFAASSMRLEALAEGMGNLGVYWGGHARFCDIDKFMQKSRRVNPLLFLASSGCSYLGFGGESADVEILRSMRKPNTQDQMARILDACRSVGIHPNATWIMGWPGETRDQIRTTARFILQNAPENKSMFTATAYPGTKLWDMAWPHVLRKYPIENYVLELGDATMPLCNFTAMSDDEFYEVRQIIDAGELEAI